jgi:hypothetical protein
MTALKAKKPGLASFLAHSRILDQNNDELVIGVQGSTFQREQIEKPENRGVIETIAAEVLNRKVRIKIQALAEEAKPAPKPAARPRAKVEEQDPIVQDALRIFGGEVIEQADDPS